MIVTGSAGGIGKAISAGFRAAGWHVVGVDLDRRKTACSHVLHLDVRRAATAHTIARFVRERRLDLRCLINNAAVQVTALFLRTSERDWQRVFDTNVKAAFLLTRALAGSLRNGGSVINITSVHSSATSAGLAAYAASKGALSALTRAMAVELAPQRTRVNAIAPGAVDTPMLAASLDRANAPTAARARLLAATPLRRIAAPADIAELALFLADEARASNITGQEFVCDGGVLARLASE